MRRTITDLPLVSEALPDRMLDPLTPVGAFYVRNHFGFPQVDSAHWRLHVDGVRPASLTLEDVRALPAHEVTVTLECAGNGRSAFGERRRGAVRSAAASGIPRWP